ncbi:MAG: ribonuclease P protein component 1 [Candidatus Njordarchaeia archaeon]
MKLPLILLKPFLGLEIEIVDCRDKKLIGKRGKIVFESKNMFGIISNSKVIYVAKDICIFKIYLPNNRIVIVDGKKLVNRFMKLRKYGRKRR